MRLQMQRLSANPVNASVLQRFILFAISFKKTSQFRPKGRGKMMVLDIARIHQQSYQYHLMLTSVIFFLVLILNSVTHAHWKHPTKLKMHKVCILTSFESRRLIRD